jgi:hypothetical protein
VTVDILPEVALLEIFDFYVIEEPIEAWQTLIHVCGKWRNVVFGSTRRLDLRLFCTVSTPVREMLDVWPPLPIIIKFYGGITNGVDNIIVALEHNDRIRELELFNIQMDKVLAGMKQPFPALTRLQLWSGDETAPVYSILGGSAPGLRSLGLGGIPILGLSKLILSATRLVKLDLRRIPHSGYIAPEALATSLSVLTRLESLSIGFESPRSCPDWRRRRPPPPTRTLIPVLADFWFFGASEYLEDLVVRIDAPLLDKLQITFFHQLIFDTPQLTQFITRTPKFKEYNEARVVFSEKDISVSFSQTMGGMLELGVSCRQPDWQLSSLAQFFRWSFPQALISPVEYLYIVGGVSPQQQWEDDIEGSQWLELLHPFTAVKNLYISLEFAPRVAATLKGLVGERAPEVLPSLQNVSSKETPPSGHV